jgi:RNA polymerase sigma-70 factor (ECF subfamily)
LAPAELRAGKKAPRHSRAGAQLEGVSVSLSATRYLPRGSRRAEPSVDAHESRKDREEPSAEVGKEVCSVAGASNAPIESDELLVAQVCDGSKEALAHLFRRFARMVRAVSYRVLRDTSETDDLVQDLFLLIHRDCRTFDSSKGPARFWILQMAYRRAISRRRYLTSRHFYTRLDLDDAASNLADPRTGPKRVEELIDGQLGSGGLQKMFEALSKNQRQTLHLFFIEGYTLDEIAAKLGQPRGNVKHHYFRGLEKLRKELFATKSSGEQNDKRLVQARSRGVVAIRTP